MENLLTILVAQYRPDPAALRRTLASLVMQDTRAFGVILADDGSPEPCFEQSRAYLAASGITEVQTSPMGGVVYCAAPRWRGCRPGNCHDGAVISRSAAGSPLIFRCWM